MGVDIGRSLKRLGDAQSAAISAQVTQEAKERLEADLKETGPEAPAP